MLGLQACIPKFSWHAVLQSWYTLEAGLLLKQPDTASSCSTNNLFSSVAGFLPLLSSAILDELELLEKVPFCPEGVLSRVY